ncbi:hypothetical protein BDF21DRAFT_415776 [Thamnidium elegans]|nr:hypothetical protein BDF21DRAFT_415776 [Thamnidium elegans]
MLVRIDSLGLLCKKVQDYIKQKYGYTIEEQGQKPIIINYENFVKGAKNPKTIEGALEQVEQYQTTKYLVKSIISISFNLSLERILSLSLSLPKPLCLSVVLIILKSNYEGFLIIKYKKSSCLLKNFLFKYFFL